MFLKLLERGRFVWPSAKEEKVALTPAQLSMLLEGDRLAGTTADVAALGSGIISSLCNQ